MPYAISSEINEYDYIMPRAKLLKKRTLYVHKKTLKCVNTLFNGGYLRLLGCFKDDVYSTWNTLMTKPWTWLV